MTEAQLLEHLATAGIDVTVHRHPPLFTVEQSKALRGDIGGVHVKNLLVRDKKRTLWLVVVPEDYRVDLKAVRTQLDTRGGLSFASAQLLAETLAVEPGSVTPLAAIHDDEGRVTVALHDSLFDEPVVCCHPLHNAATVQMSGPDLVRFLRGVAHEPVRIE